MRDLINFVICKVTFQSFDQRIETAVVYQFAIIFDTVKVRTEADGIDAGLILHVFQVLNDLIESRMLRSLFQEGALEIDTHDTACIAQRLQLVIGQIPSVVTEGSRTGMGSDERFFAVFCHIIESAF